MKVIFKLLSAVFFTTSSQENGTRGIWRTGLMTITEMSIIFTKKDRTIWNSVLCNAGDRFSFAKKIHGFVSGNKIAFCLPV